MTPIASTAGGTTDSLLSSRLRHRYILAMARRYTETVFLNNGHTQGITCVEFSSDGTLIATGGLDGNLCVWATDNGKLLHTYACSSAITSIAWIAGERPTIVAGSKTGNIAILVVNVVSRHRI